MILPKGTVEYSMNGGEEIFKDVIKEMREGEKTGYLLVLGSLEDSKSNDSEFTGQMVFNRGEPQLCEAITGTQSHKGNDGIYHFYKSMLSDSNSIELHTKIDVGPPLAFFKECKVDPEKTDPESFMRDYNKELEERRKREEEERKRKERKRKIIDTVEGWKNEGYVIKSYPKILNSSMDEIDSWFNGISSDLERIKEISDWADNIEDKEVKEKIEKLRETAKDLENLQGLEVLVKEIENDLERVREKRNEMEKWVNLWKDEGFNTTLIEEALTEDLHTAWNELTKFMDQIQVLKDLRKELTELGNSKESEGFQSEIREIEFLTNDPSEIASIKELMEKLKKGIHEEKEKKKSLLNEAKEVEKKGFDVSHIEKNMDKRYSELVSDYQLLKNNSERILEIRKELKGMERRDISEEIDHLLENSQDPLRLDEYEKEFIDIQEKLMEYNKERSDILTKISTYKSEGFLVDMVLENEENKLEEFKVSFNDFENRVNKLKNLSSRLNSLDRRWMEDDFKLIEELLNDPSKVEDASTMLNDLEKRIKEREEKREAVKKQMEEWSSEGFDVGRLQEVIEEDLPAFTAIHKDMEKKIGLAREQLHRLEDMDTSHFPVQAQEIKSKLKDPYQTENAKNALDTLESDIREDASKRSDLKILFNKLEKNGFDLTDMDGIFKSPPEELPMKMEELRQKVSKVEEMERDMENWDALETNLLSEGMEELRSHIKRLSDYEGALVHFEDFGNKIKENIRKREEIKEQAESWKECGYLISDLEGKLKSSMDDLNEEYEITQSRIEDLKRLTDIFDGLNTEHFTSEASEIEFKLFDPAMVEEIEKDINELRDKIDEDQRKRDEYSKRIEEYISEGYTGARKLEDVLKEDISIIELEFKDFDKEVQMLKKHMESTGFVPPMGESETDETDHTQEEKTEEPETTPETGETESADLREVKEEETEEREPDTEKEGEKTEEPGETNGSEGGSDVGTFLCTNCGEQVPSDSANCPFCGASFEGEVYECPRCHSEVPEGSTKCPGCGAEFEL